MRRVLLVCLLAGCGKRGPCDRAPIEAALRERPDTKKSVRHRLAARAILDGCRHRIDAVRRGFLEELARAPDDEAATLNGYRGEAVQRAWVPVCPREELSAVAKLDEEERPLAFYDRCRIERFGVLDRDEVDEYVGYDFVWTVWPLLQDAGLRPDEARTLMRDLLMRYRFYEDESDLVLEE